MNRAELYRLMEHPEGLSEETLPVLKEILAINPGIKILASPWSAPAWMKKNNNMYMNVKV